MADKQDLNKNDMNKHASVEAHRTSTLDKELQATKGCWEWENSLSLKNEQFLFIIIVFVIL